MNDNARVSAEALIDIVREDCARACDTLAAGSKDYGRDNNLSRTYAHAARTIREGDNAPELFQHGDADPQWLNKSKPREASELSPYKAFRAVLTAHGFVGNAYGPETLKQAIDAAIKAHRAAVKLDEPKPEHKRRPYQEGDLWLDALGWTSPDDIRVVAKDGARPTLREMTNLLYVTLDGTKPEPEMRTKPEPEMRTNIAQDEATREACATICDKMSENAGSVEARFAFDLAAKSIRDGDYPKPEAVDPYTALGSVEWIRAQVGQAPAGFATHMGRIERALKGFPPLNPAKQPISPEMRYIAREDIHCGMALRVGQDGAWRAEAGNVTVQSVFKSGSSPANNGHAQPIEEPGLCSGCGSATSQDQLTANGHVSCCPERKLVPMTIGDAVRMVLKTMFMGHVRIAKQSSRPGHLHMIDACKGDRDAALFLDLFAHWTNDLVDRAKEIYGIDFDAMEIEA